MSPDEEAFFAETFFDELAKNPLPPIPSALDVPLEGALEEFHEGETISFFDQVHDVVAKDPAFGPTVLKAYGAAIEKCDRAIRAGLLRRGRESMDRERERAEAAIVDILRPPLRDGDTQEERVQAENASVFLLGMLDRHEVFVDDLHDPERARRQIHLLNMAIEILTPRVSFELVLS